MNAPSEKRDLPPEWVPPSAVSLIDLSDGHCRWPLGTGRAALFCGAERVAGCSYCAAHRLRAFASPAALEMRPDDLRRRYRRTRSVLLREGAA